MNAMLSLLVLRAREPERLARFYGVLGMVFEKHRHGSGPEHFSAMVEGVVFEIYPLKEGEGGDLWDEGWVCGGGCGEGFCGAGGGGWEECGGAEDE